jgi:hypothetical protein
LGATFICSALFDLINLKKIMSEHEDNEELRPRKMRGVAFPKAKYGVILAVIIILVVNLLIYKETIFSFFK